MRARPFSAGVRSAEEVVFAAERDDAQRPFGGVVVNLMKRVSAGQRERA